MGNLAAVSLVVCTPRRDSCPVAGAVKVVEEVQSLLLLLRAFAVVLADWHIVVVVVADVADDAALKEVKPSSEARISITAAE